MSRWLLALLTLPVLLACERTDRSVVDIAAARPERTADGTAALHQSIVAAMAETQQHLRLSPGAPKGHGESPCPDVAFSRSTSDGDPLELVVRAVDARAAPKNLLPLEVVARLESDDFAEVLRHVEGGRAALWDPVAARPVSREAGEAAIEELGRLRATRFIAEVRIIGYAEPRLFIRKGAKRREWDAGSIAFDLVIYDLSERSAICQAPAWVRGDASTAPTSRRLREKTRLSLQRQLVDRAWSAMGEALGRISTRLELPDPAHRAAPSQRFSSSERVPSGVTGS